MAARGGTISLVLCSVISATVPPVSPWLYLSVISSPAPGVVIGHKLHSSYRIKINLYSTKMEHKFVCSQNICCVAKNASFSKKGYLWQVRYWSQPMTWRTWSELSLPTPAAQRGIRSSFIVCAVYVQCMCSVCAGYMQCMWSVCAAYVQCVRSVCAAYVQCMYSVSAVYVQCMCCVCAVYVQCMYSVSAVYVHCMCSVCAAYVQCLCIICWVNARTRANSSPPPASHMIKLKGASTRACVWAT